MNAPMLVVWIALGWLTASVIVGLIAGPIVARRARDQSVAQQVVLDVFDGHFT